MIFIMLMSTAAFAVAAAAAFFSVYGLAHTFSGAFWSVVFMGGSVEAGKLILLSFLYRFRNSVGWAIKIPAIVLTIAIMLLTSLGIYGYLSAAYQTDTVSAKQLTASIELKKQELATLQKRKEDIDKQISQLPTKDVRGRQKLMTQFGPEITQVNARVTELTAEMQKLAQDQIVSDAHVGPIVFIAKAMGADPDSATNILILLIIFVFDPLAIFLTIATNIAVKEYNDAKVAKTSDTPPTIVPDPIVEPAPVIPVEPDTAAINEDEPVLPNTKTVEEVTESLAAHTDEDVPLEPTSNEDHDEVVVPPIEKIVEIYDELESVPVKSEVDNETIGMIKQFFARRNLLQKVRSGKME